MKKNLEPHKLLGVRIAPALWKHLRREAFNREMTVSRLVAEAVVALIGVPADDVPRNRVGKKIALKSPVVA